MIGPLSSEHRLICSDVPDKNLMKLSEQVGISPLYLSKILYILQQKGGNTLFFRGIGVLSQCDHPQRLQNFE